MPISPEDSHSAYLLSVLGSLARGPASIDKLLVNATREFLLALDSDPSTPAESAVHQGAAMVRNWSEAVMRGDHAKAGEYQRSMENAAPSHPFPFREAMNAYRQADFANAMQTDAYRPYNGDLSFGVIKGTLPDDAKLGVIGDFGTGGEDAAFLIESMIAQHGDIAAILHLGDIYDSGWPFEITENFEKPIQQAMARHNLNIPIFAVPGDHEYHSGGAGYYGMIDTINNSAGAQWQQAASYFCLRTKSGSWQILGADTGYAPSRGQPGLKPAEQTWHQDKVDHFSGKTVFLTHRQFFSAYDDLGGDYCNHLLAASMKPLLPKINLFLWGHEHRFVPFVDGLAVAPAKLRLMGGSARETSPKFPAKPLMVLETPKHTRVWTGTANGYSDHTYAILDLGASSISYFAVSAWDTSNPTKYAPTQPLLTDRL